MGSLLPPTFSPGGTDVATSSVLILLFLLLLFQSLLLPFFFLFLFLSLQNKDNLVFLLVPPTSSAPPLHPALPRHAVATCLANERANE